MTEAVDVLQGYTKAALQQMARQRRIGVGNANKEVLIAQLAPILYDPAWIQMAVGELAPTERELLDRLVLLGGSAPTSLLRRELERAGTVRPRPTGGGWGTTPSEEGSPEHRGSDVFADVVARLGVLGLAYTAGSYANHGAVDLTTPGQRLFVPAPVMAQLPRVALELSTIVEPAVTIVAEPATLLYDLYALVGLVHRETLPLVGSGLIAKKALARLNAELRVPEDVASARSEEALNRLPFLRALAEEVGLVVARAGALRPGDDPIPFLAEPAGERRQRLFRAWLTTRRWCELVRLPGVRARPPVGGTAEAPDQTIAARQRVAAEVARLPVGQWIALDHLVGRVRRHAYELLVPRPMFNYAYGYYGQEPNVYKSATGLTWSFEPIAAGRYAALTDESGWELVEGGFVRSIVTGPLHWLGAVDLGGPTEARPSAFRLRPDGARLLRLEAPESAPAPHNVVVQPNFQLLAFEPTGEDTRFVLDRIAERVRTGLVAEYRLTRDSVYRAQRGGMEADEIVTFLDRVGRTPLPQNVRRTLEEWGAQLDRIVVRRGVALVEADASTLDELASDPALGPLLGQRIAPSAAMMPFANLRPLYAGMLADGRLPAVTEGRDEAAGGLLTVDPTGRIELHHRRPNVYALAALRAFADEAPNGALRLTAESLRRAARAGLDADQMLAVLARYHRGEPPPELPAMVRRWAKDWGRGGLVEAVLLQVESAEVLTDLLADPEFRPLLRRLPGAETIALVRFEAVERLRAALADRGMDLGDQLLR